MPVTRDDVKHIAALARLALPEERVPELVAQLNGILAHLEKLDQIEKAAAFIAGPDYDPAFAGRDDLRTLRLRPDHGPPVPMARPIQAFAPSVRDGFFLVPRLATHEEEGE
jgi:aspartyl-tRNA(Asn)/glutamyl-tRNA(Gln) amidotransferase subunit C